MVPSGLREAAAGGPRPRRCSHEEQQGQDVAGWVRSICVATFDVGTGHTLEQVYPPDSLDDGDRQRIRMLAMPDCNTTQIGDCFYCFRTRKSHRMPLMSSSLLDQTFEYCYAFFRQERNEECARGMFQKSVVVVSRYPYVNLFERLVKVIGPLYFTHGSAVLEAVFSSFEDWPAPCPGSLCPLPFLGETVMFQVPDIDMPPQVASKYRYHRGVHLCASWSRARVVSLTRTLSGCGSISSGFPISGGSPGSCRKGVGPSPLEDPEGGGGEQEEEEQQQHPVSRRGSTGVGADSAGAGAPAGSGGGAKDPPPLSGGGPPRSGDPASTDGGASVCLQGAGRRPSAGAALEDDGAPASSPPHWKKTCGTPTGESNEQEGWGAVQARRTPSPGGGRGGGGGAFWNGPCGSPRGLTSPGFRLSAGEALGEGSLPPGMRTGGHARSSFGAGSMASVICESPSENWLATPRSGSTPILTLDGRAGSNLAQSCYYVADQDSEEDEEDEDMGERFVLEEEGWQGARWLENGGGDQSAVGEAAGGREEAGEGGGDGRDARVREGEGSAGETMLENGRQSEVATPAGLPVAGDRSDAPTHAAATGDQPETVTGVDGSVNVSGRAPAAASTAAAAAAAAAAMDAATAAAATAAAAAAAATHAAVRQARLTDQPATATATAAAAAAPSRASSASVSAAPLTTKPGASSSRGRATSLSPPRSSAPHSLAAVKPSKTPNPRSTGAWSALRAWADTAPEDPWDVPAPLQLPAALARRESTTAAAAAVAESIRREGRGGGGSGQETLLTLPGKVKTEGGGAKVKALSRSVPAAAPAPAPAPGLRTTAGDEASSREDSAGSGSESAPKRGVGIVAAGNGNGDVGTAKPREVSNGGRVLPGADPQRSKHAVAAAAAAAAAAATSGASRKDLRAGAPSGAPSSAGAVAAPPGETGPVASEGGPGSAAGEEEGGGVLSLLTTATAEVSAVGGASGGVPGAFVTAEAEAVAVTGNTRDGSGRVQGKRDDTGVGAVKGKDKEGEGDDFGRQLARRGSSSSLVFGREGRASTFHRSGSPDNRNVQIHRTASNLRGGRSPFAEMLLADEARFRAKQGLFQSIGLYSIFGKKLVEHLWLLWELVLTGGPTLVLGSSVGASSAAILGMVSLASPVYYGGDFRPHFTTFDPDYREIVAAHDKVSKQQMWGSSVLGVPAAGSAPGAGGGFPSLLLGVINPIFLRTLSRWPNAIVLPGAPGRSPTAGKAGFHKLQKNLSEEAPCGSPKNRNCPTPAKEGLASPRPAPVRVQVVRAGASLDQVVGQDDRPNEPIIVARQQPVMVPDVAVLSRLVDPSSPFNPATVAAAAAAAASNSAQGGQPPTPIAGVVAAAAEAANNAKAGPETKGQWKDSLRAINDIILRRHFADLTRSFLAPYDQYFRRARPPQALSAWQALALGRLSVYTEAELLLPRFDQEEFLTEMFVAGPPKAFVHVQWETLYRRFMDSPNFQPWFTTQRMEGVDRIREMSRAMCLRTTPQGIVEACAPARLPQLLAKIKAAIARQWQKKNQSVDWDLLERMEQHQKAVASAIVAQSARGKGTVASATGSMQP